MIDSFTLGVVERAESMIERLRLTVGSLLLITGISHVSQLFVYGPTPMVRVASVSGVIYLLLGLLIFRYLRPALWGAAVLCSLGFLMGSYRLLFVEPTFFGVFHQLIHLVIVPTSVYMLVMRHGADEAR